MNTDMVPATLSHEGVMAQAARVALVVGCLALVDGLSHLVLAFAGWAPETPLRRLSALQTVGTQATVAVVGLTLVGAGLHILQWPLPRRRIAVAILAIGGVVAIWLALGIPGLTNGVLADVGVAQPERLLRGSRQAMAGWLGLGVWALGMAALLWRWKAPNPALS